MKTNHCSMPKVEDFFTSKNVVIDPSTIHSKQKSNYLEPIIAISRINYTTLYVIDYEKKGFEYVSDNPLFLCGYTANQVMEMGYEFYFKCVTEEDLNLLLTINNVGFDFYEKTSIEDRKKYSISYDFHLKNENGKKVLINQKLTPLFLTEDGKIWKALCIISLSTAKNAGNIKVFKEGENTVYEYDLKNTKWIQSERLSLTEREKEIIQHSIRGFTINEIANLIHVSPDTVKFHRRKLFEKLEVGNISEAIVKSLNNKLL